MSQFVPYNGLVNTFTFADLVSAINDEIHKHHENMGVITVNLQFEKEAQTNTDETINCAYNIVVHDSTAQLTEPKKSDETIGTFNETARAGGGGL